MNERMPDIGAIRRLGVGSWWADDWRAPPGLIRPNWMRAANGGTVLVEPPRLMTDLAAEGHK